MKYSNSQTIATKKDLQDGLKGVYYAQAKL